MLVFLFLLNLRFKYAIPQFGEPQFLTQKLDHYNTSDTRTFKQRYYEHTESYNSSNPKIIIFIGGESTLTFGGNATIRKGPIEEMANVTKSYFAALEHRFYGESSPQLDTTIDVLEKYLTSDQALADLANFTQYIRDTKCKANPSCPVLVIGGSYAGTLSSLFRMKYPHLVNFSWASSPPLNIKLDFPEYDAHVGKQIHDYDPQCHHNSLALMDLLDHNETALLYFRKKTNISDVVDNVSVLSIVSDTFAGIVQYDSITHGIEDYCQRHIDTLDKFIDFFNEMTPNPDSGDSFLLDNASYGQPVDYKNDRAWTWQTCNEFGWFQTAAQGENRFRSSQINVSYYERICQKVYQGYDQLPTFTDINVRYGLTSPKTTNVIYVNGKTDPWSIVSLNDDDVLNQLQQYSYHIEGGSHCSELSITASGTETIQLATIRREIMKTFIKWMNFNETECAKHGTPNLCVCVCKDGYSGDLCNQAVVEEKTFKLFAALVIGLPTLMMGVIGIAAWCLFKKEQQEPEIRTITS